MSKPKLIVVLGPTACGKSGLGVDLAKRVGGEIVSADSRQVYRGLDLGTGKITLEEMAGVPHHMLDIIDPGTPYSAAEFQRGAYAAIDGILARGKVPLLVGGTGLYVRAVAEGYVFQDAPPNPALRDRLETWDVPALYARFQTLTGLTLSESERNNRQRLVRAVEKAESGAYADAARAPRYDVLQLGCAYPREILHRRIDLRLRARLDAGMAGEVSGLLDAGVSGDFLEGLGLEYRWRTSWAGPSSALPSGRSAGSKRTRCCGWIWITPPSLRRPGRRSAFWPGHKRAEYFFQKIFKDL